MEEGVLKYEDLRVFRMIMVACVILETPRFCKSPFHLMVAADLMRRAVQDARELYGDSMVAGVKPHYLEHLPSYCQEFGLTLSQMSTFVFESRNRVLGQMIQGKNDRVKEYSKKFLLELTHGMMRDIVKFRMGDYFVVGNNLVQVIDEVGEYSIRLNYFPICQDLFTVPVKTSDLLIFTTLLSRYDVCVYKKSVLKIPCIVVPDRRDPNTVLVLPYRHFIT
jgi:hypothetical protein